MTSCYILATIFLGGVGSRTIVFVLVSVLVFVPVFVFVPISVFVSVCNATRRNVRCVTLWVTICVTVVRYAVGDDVCYGALQCEFITSCVPATVTTRPSTVVLTSSI